MVCEKCAVGADLAKAVAGLPDDVITSRLSDVVGRPYILTVTVRAVDKLHGQCKGCTCQCLRTAY